MAPDFELNAWSAAHLQRVEQALTALIPEQTPADLGLAMRYAVLDGGKRLRPLLVLATAQSLGHAPEQVMPAACAVELIHAYSLVHDDLPCMDNDVLRRGKPTAHVQFGEAVALLAGDALQALAFAALTAPHPDLSLDIQARWCAQLAQASGMNGMAGGQAIDLQSVGDKTLSEQALQDMHRRKTGALLQASVMMGAAVADPNRPHAVAQDLALSQFGAAIGLAFQVVDDILDVIGDTQALGKTAGKDAQNDKPTYVSVLGLERAQAHALALQAQAVTALHQAHLPWPQPLLALAQQVVARVH